jgi:hypothetical protein
MKKKGVAFFADLGPEGNQKKRPAEKNSFPEPAPEKRGRPKNFAAFRAKIKR